MCNNTRNLVHVALARLGVCDGVGVQSDGNPWPQCLEQEFMSLSPDVFQRFAQNCERDGSSLYDALQPVRPSTLDPRTTSHANFPRDRQDSGGDESVLPLEDELEPLAVSAASSSHKLHQQFDVTLGSPPMMPATSEEIASVGSIGHPDSCARPCRFVGTRRGCRDEQHCPQCHLCRWTMKERRLSLQKQRADKRTGES